jgi:hypothetical protein
MIDYYFTVIYDTILTLLACFLRIKVLFDFGTFQLGPWTSLNDSLLTPWQRGGANWALDYVG